MTLEPLDDLISRLERERLAADRIYNDALTALAALDPRQSKVVELHFFGGLSMEEIAEVLQVSLN